MKEIKPRLIFTDRKQRSWAGSAWNLLIILLIFCVGVYVGVKISDMGLIDGVQDVGHKEKGTVLADRTAEQIGGEEDAGDEGKVTIRQSSSSDAGQSVDYTHSQEGSTAGLGEGEGNEIDYQEPANSEQAIGVEKKESFTVQIGAFKEIDRANRAVNELNIRGYEPYILPYVNSLGTSWYLVRIGQFKTKEEATDYAASFQTTEGMEAIVERIE